jgi:drug/metabolite transporter (DMT)-like permease
VTEPNPLHGIGLKLASVLVFVGMAICIKAGSASVPPGELVFFRSFFAIPVTLGWLIWKGAIREGLATKMPLGHVWRGLMGTSGMALGFTALGLLPLPEATAIGYAAPILTVVFAAMFLGETVRAFRLTAVLIGMAGVMVVLMPRFSAGALSGATGMEAAGAMAALMGAVCAALTSVYVRKLTQTESTTAITFYFAVTSACLGFLTLPFGWVLPSPSVAALLVLAGFLGGLGQVLLTSSYRHAEAAVIAPFEYVSILLALAAGYFFFGETPTKTMLSGAVLVILAGLLIIWREGRLGLERAKQKEVMTPQG